jgi:stage II sporulation protein D
VWSQALPYLQPVDSPEPAERIPNYYSRVEFSTEAFCAMVCERYRNARFDGERGKWLTDAVPDEAGNVETVTVGGVPMKGAVLRSLLGLRSDCFTWEIGESHIVFYVTGYGHGVGLSQYGANQMAEEGADWQEILSHYYTGVTIGPYCFTNAAQA